MWREPNSGQVLIPPGKRIRCQRIPEQSGAGRHHRRRRGERLPPCPRRCGSTRGPSWSPPATRTPRCSSGADRNGASTRSRPIPRRFCADPDVDAVIIATPNFTHQPIAVAAARAGKHVMCEKPLGLNAGEVRAMYEAARDAGVVHMTAFTYRFAPSMRYLRHLLKSGALGTPRHFRSQRFLDWPETSWGWRQYKDKAGAGDLFDMTIHRIDFALDLLGPIEPRLRRRRPVRPAHADPRRQAVPPLRGRRLVVPDRRVRQRRDRRLGRDDPGQGLRPRRLRPRVGRDQRLGGLGRLPAARAEHHPAGQDRPGPGPGPRARRVPQAGRQPPRPGPGRAGHRLPLRPRLGVRLGDRRAPPGRPELPTTASTPRSSPTPSSSRTPSVTWIDTVLADAELRFDELRLPLDRPDRQRELRAIVISALSLSDPPDRNR